jgi:hypothetical protein
MSLKKATGYFIKIIILATPPILNDLTFFQNKEPRFTLAQRFSKLSIYKTYGDL